MKTIVRRILCILPQVRASPSQATVSLSALPHVNHSKNPLYPRLGYSTDTSDGNTKIIVSNLSMNLATHLILFFSWNSRWQYLPIYGVYSVDRTEHANTELKKDEAYMLWIASQTSLPAAKAKLIVLLPTWSVKVFSKFQYLGEIDEQCRGLCVQKPGTAGFYVLHITRNSTTSSPEDFSWSSFTKKR